MGGPISRRSARIRENFPSKVPPTNDPGSDTQSRFRYQHSYTCLLALLMYDGKVHFQELMCEQHEDILAVKKNGKCEGVQIKTRKSDRGPFTINDPKIKDSIIHFIKLNRCFQVNSVSLSLFLTVVSKTLMKIRVF